MIRATRVLACLAACLAWAVPAHARHGDITIDARRATPGIHLTLTERVVAGQPPTYRLAASGVPRATLFGIWTKDFGQSFRQVASGFRLNAAGVLEAMNDDGRLLRLEDVVLDPGVYPRGAGWEVALVSADQNVMALAKVIPRPIAARNGTCGVSLELASRGGDRFIVTTQGFEPGEAVVVELRQATGTTQRRLSVPPEGRMPLDVISHAVASPDHQARYSIKGAACDVAVDYTWGEPALLAPSRQVTGAAKSGGSR